VANHVGAKYAVAVSSGTAALHLACIAADIGPGCEVVTTPNTFVASANCVLYVGGEVQFADIDPHTLNIDVEDLDLLCRASTKIKAIIPVHFAGLPCDMRRIKEVADDCGAVVIEDACHALGAKYENGSTVGSCQFSKMTVFSFHPVKGIAAGEGGMITTNDKDVFQRLLSLRSHGICKGNFEFPGVSVADKSILKPDAALESGELKYWYYEMQELGFNYRITDIQCALALSQMKKISIFLQRRNEIAKAYDDVFQSINGVSVTQLTGRDRSSHHIYVVRIDFDAIGLSRHEFMNKLASSGVGSQVHYIPVPMHPYYEKLGFCLNDYPETERYYQEALSLPLYFGLRDEDQHLVISSIRSLLK
jgi:perosamine synthetase